MSRLQLHARLFALGEQYCIFGLQALCVMKYQSRLNSICPELEFIKSIPDVYTSTAQPVRDFRDVVAGYARDHISNLICDVVEAKAAYDDVTQKAPEFAKDLLDLYHEARSYDKRLWESSFHHPSNTGMTKGAKKCKRCRCCKC